VHNAEASSRAPNVTAGVSRWLFVGQISASVGFTIYSSLLHKWVFLFSNVAMIATAIVGESIYISYRKRRGS
jgi:MtN3 and saliva related transmembrane protein